MLASLAACAVLASACGRSGIPVSTAPPDGGRDGTTAVTDGSRDMLAAPDLASDLGTGDLRLDGVAPPPPDATADRGADGARDAADARDDLPLERFPPDATVDRPPDLDTCNVDCNQLPHVRRDVFVPCVSGQCYPPYYACEDGYQHCAGNTNLGCETSITTTSNCGYCNNSCFSPNSECRLYGSNYYCAERCAAPTPDTCGLSCVDLQSDFGNCGVCFQSCYLPGANETACRQGKCAVISCAAGAGDCTDEPGCETPLNTPTNCGSCGDKSCGFANTALTCSDGATCTAALCVPGFANCDAASPDCESPFTATASCMPSYLDTLPIASQILDRFTTAVAADGSVFLAGTYSGAVDFDPSAGRDIRTATDPDGFVTKFNPDGSYAWTATLGGRGAIGVDGLAPTATGALVVSGWYTDSIDLDPSPTVTQTLQTAVADQSDGFVLELTAAGTLAWGGSFPGAAFNSINFASRVAVNPAGEVYLAGAFSGMIDFDPGPGVSSHAASSNSGALVKLSATGVFQSAQFFENGSCQASLSSVTVASDGSVWAVGVIDSATGCPLDDRPVPFVQTSTLIVKRDPALLPLGKWTLGDTGQVWGSSVASGRDGSVYISGAAEAADFDPGPGVVRRTMGNGEGGFILKLDANAGFRWVRVVTDPQLGLLSPGIDRLAATPDGGVVGVTLQLSPFVTRVSADGDAIWSFVPGGPSTNIQSIASSGGRFAIAGISSGNADFDPGPGIDIVYGDISYVSRYQF